MNTPQTILIYSVPLRRAEYVTCPRAEYYYDSCRDVWGWFLPAQDRAYFDLLGDDWKADFQGLTFRAAGYSKPSARGFVEGVFLWRDARPL